ncbi:hypothetical protein GX411_02340 [Candidatus Fermentibacteria bacterium]|nr:hypothetical protein [Candidatus Fermentibacteria bacterium]
MSGWIGPLEFDRLLESVASLAGSRAGRDRVLSLRPEWTREGAARLAGETREAQALSAAGVALPPGCADDLADAFDLISSGVVCAEPSRLRRAGEALIALSGFIGAVSSAGIETPFLAGRLSALPDLRKLGVRLTGMITPSGDISPDASPAMRTLSRRVERIENSLHRSLEKLARSLAGEGALRDMPPTMRNGRFVLPVLAAKKSSVPGIVHDRSDTGGTLFIEPQSLTEEGNSRQEALLDLQQERRRILRDATALLREQAGPLEAAADAAAGLDACWARAGYAGSASTVFPQEGPMSLLDLRHPLIPRGEVVANDFVLPGSWKVLVISGPNAGGKSVMLKSVGLAVASAHAGLGVTAGQGSTMPFFDSLLVSIGDRQSLVEKLSTYSARLEEDLAMLRSCGPGTLVLIDEPAAGTDPETGAALAAAVLEAVAAAGARAVVTTHLGQLKSLASSHKGFLNASMNFEEDSLSPDYRFRPGIPGSSFTLEIAGRMGFPEAVLSRARRLSGDSFRLDVLISELTAEVGALRSEREDLGRRLDDAAGLAAELEKRLADHDRESEEILGRMRAEMEEAVRKANSRADSLLATMGRTTPEGRRAAREEIRSMSSLVPGAARRPESTSVTAAPGISPGDSVSVEGWRGTGTVLEIRGGSALVGLGGITLEKPFSELTRIERAPGGGDRPPEWNIEPPGGDLDLRGMTAEEAVAELDERIDACIASGLGRIRIIHGKGRGVLMKAVVDYLKRDRRVSSSSPGEPSEGGSGVTVAILRSGLR